MRSTLVLLTAVAMTGAVSTVYARDLYMAPPEGWVTTVERTAVMTLRGQVAQGLFEQLPESTIVRNPNATCAPTGVVKMAGGIVCTHWPPDKDPRNAKLPAAYECEIRMNLDTGEMRPQSNEEECGEDESFIQKQRKEAKKRGYWITRDE